MTADNNQNQYHNTPFASSPGKSEVSPLEIPLLSEYLYLLRGDSTIRVYCAITETSFRCYSTNPAEHSDPATILPFEDISLSSISISKSTFGNKPKGFTVSRCGDINSLFEFICPTTSSMSKWVNFLQVLSSAKALWEGATKKQNKPSVPCNQNNGASGSYFKEFVHSVTWNWDDVSVSQSEEAQMTCTSIENRECSLSKPSKLSQRLAMKYKEHASKEQHEKKHKFFLLEQERKKNRIYRGAPGDENIYNDESNGKSPEWVSNMFGNNSHTSRKFTPSRYKGGRIDLRKGAGNKSKNSEASSTLSSAAGHTENTNSQNSQPLRSRGQRISVDQGYETMSKRQGTSPNRAAKQAWNEYHLYDRTASPSAKSNVQIIRGFSPSNRVRDHMSPHSRRHSDTQASGCRKGAARCCTRDPLKGITASGKNSNNKSAGIEGRKDRVKSDSSGASVVNGQTSSGRGQRRNTTGGGHDDDDDDDPRKYIPRRIKHVSDAVHKQESEDSLSESSSSDDDIDSAVDYRELLPSRLNNTEKPSSMKGTWSSMNAKLDGNVASSEGVKDLLSDGVVNRASYGHISNVTPDRGLSTRDATRHTRDGDRTVKSAPCKSVNSFNNNTSKSWNRKAQTPTADRRRGSSSPHTRRLSAPSYHTMKLHSKRASGFFEWYSSRGKSPATLKYGRGESQTSNQDQVAFHRRGLSPSERHVPVVLFRSSPTVEPHKRTLSPTKTISAGTSTSHSHSFGRNGYLHPAVHNSPLDDLPPSINSLLSNATHHKQDKTFSNGSGGRFKTPDELRCKRPTHDVHKRDILTDAAEWSRMLDWLETIGMGKYASSFKSNGVTKLSVVELLSYHDLVQLNISSNDVPRIMDSIREISRRTKSFAELAMSPVSQPTKLSNSCKSSPGESRKPSPALSRKHDGTTGSLSQRSRISDNTSFLHLCFSVEDKPKNDKCVQSVSIPALIAVFDNGNRRAFFFMWNVIHKAIVRETFSRDGSTLQSLYVLEFYCQLYFAVWPMLVQASRDRVADAMLSLKKYLHSLVSSSEPVAASLVNSRLFAAYAGIILVPEPRENPAYAALFEPRWRQGLRKRLFSFLDGIAVQCGPQQSEQKGLLTGSNERNPHQIRNEAYRKGDVHLDSDASKIDGLRSRPRAESSTHADAENDMLKVLHTLEASEKLNRALRDTSPNSASIAADATKQYRASVPQEYTPNSCSQSHTQSQIYAKAVSARDKAPQHSGSMMDPCANIDMLKSGPSTASVDNLISGADVPHAPGNKVSWCTSTPDAEVSSSMSKNPNRRMSAMLGCGPLVMELVSDDDDDNIINTIDSLALLTDDESDDSNNFDVTPKVNAGHLKPVHSDLSIETKECIGEEIIPYISHSSESSAVESTPCDSRANFPSPERHHAARVSITQVFSAVPDSVKELCLQQATNCSDNRGDQQYEQRKSNGTYAQSVSTCPTEDVDQSARSSGNTPSSALDNHIDRDLCVISEPDVNLSDECDASIREHILHNKENIDKDKGDDTNLDVNVNSEVLPISEAATLSASSATAGSEESSGNTPSSALDNHIDRDLCVISEPDVNLSDECDASIREHILHNEENIDKDKGDDTNLDVNVNSEVLPISEAATLSASSATAGSEESSGNTPSSALDNHIDRDLCVISEPDVNLSDECDASIREHILHNEENIDKDKGDDTNLDVNVNSEVLPISEAATLSASSATAGSEESSGNTPSSALDNHIDRDLCVISELDVNLSDECEASIREHILHNEENIDKDKGDDTNLDVNVNSEVLPISEAATLSASSATAGSEESSGNTPSSALDNHIDRDLCVISEPDVNLSDECEASIREHILHNEENIDKDKGDDTNLDVNVNSEVLPISEAATLSASSATAGSEESSGNTPSSALDNHIDRDLCVISEPDVNLSDECDASIREHILHNEENIDKDKGDDTNLDVNVNSEVLPISEAATLSASSATAGSEESSGNTPSSALDNHIDRDLCVISEPDVNLSDECDASIREHILHNEENIDKDKGDDTNLDVNVNSEVLPISEAATLSASSATAGSEESSGNTPSSALDNHIDRDLCVISEPDVNLSDECDASIREHILHNEENIDKDKGDDTNLDVNVNSEVLPISEAATLSASSATAGSEESSGNTPSSALDNHIDRDLCVISELDVNLSDECEASIREHILHNEENIDKDKGDDTNLDVNVNSEVLPISEAATLSASSATAGSEESSGNTPSSALDNHIDRDLCVISEPDVNLSDECEASIREHILHNEENIDKDKGDDTNLDVNVNSEVLPISEAATLSASSATAGSEESSGNTPSSALDNHIDRDLCVISEPDVNLSDECDASIREHILHNEENIDKDKGDDTNLDVNVNSEVLPISEAATLSASSATAGSEESSGNTPSSALDNHIDRDLCVISEPDVNLSDECEASIREHILHNEENIDKDKDDDTNLDVNVNSEVLPISEAATLSASTRVPNDYIEYLKRNIKGLEKGSYSAVSGRFPVPLPSGCIRRETFGEGGVESSGELEDEEDDDNPEESAVFELPFKLSGCSNRGSFVVLSKEEECAAMKPVSSSGEVSRPDFLESSHAFESPSSDDDMDKVGIIHQSTVSVTGALFETLKDIDPSDDEECEDDSVPNNGIEELMALFSNASPVSTTDDDWNGWELVGNRWIKKNPMTEEEIAAAAAFYEENRKRGPHATRSRRLTAAGDADSEHTGIVSPLIPALDSNDSDSVRAAMRDTQVKNNELMVDKNCESSDESRQSQLTKRDEAHALL